MKQIIFFALLVAQFTASASDEPITISSQIEQVTVFANDAQVTRNGRVSLPKGNTQLVFKELSNSIKAENIQLNSSSEFTILNISYRNNYLQPISKKPLIEPLQKQQEALSKKIDLEQTEINILQEAKEILNKNQTFAPQSLKVADVRELVDYYTTKRLELAQKIREHTFTKQGYEAEFNALDSQIREMAAVPKGKPTGEIIVNVYAEQALTNIPLTLTYLVQNAGWFISYDLRVKDVDSPINLSYKANIHQHSGEDWKDVRLTLSSADNKRKTEQPIINPLFLRMPQKVVVKKGKEVTIRLKSGEEIQLDDTDSDGVPDQMDREPLTPSDCPIDMHGVLLDSDGDGVKDCYDKEPHSRPGTPIDSEGRAPAPGYNRATAVQFDINESAQNIPIKVMTLDNTTSFSYEIKMPYTVPDDGKVYIAEIKTEKIPAKYEYYVAPMLDTDAFLTAKIIDWETYNLLDGEANLFFEGTYLGKSNLNTQTTNDTLSISLGTDKNIVVTRTKLKEYLKKEFLGNEKQEQRAYEINIRNKKNQYVQIVVEDRMPVTNDKEIIVKLEDNNGNAQRDEATGKLRWTIQMEPRKEKKIGFRYSVKYPKDIKLTIE